MVGEPKTRRGREVRDRIVERAAELVAAGGVDAMSLDAVRAAAGVSKSQLYHYFADRDELVVVAVARRCDLVLEELTLALGSVGTLAELEEALGGFAGAYEQRLSGCPVGTLAGQVAESNDSARVRVADAFDRWEELFHDALERMRERGELRQDTPSPALATAMLASLEGGMLLGQVRRSVASLHIAMEAALRAVREYRN